MNAARDPRPAESRDARLDRLADGGREAEFAGPFAEPDAPTRRRFLEAMGASLALAGLAGCDMAPDEKAHPYVVEPEGVDPGVARHYASAVLFAGYAQPVVGRTYVGRPVKLEGNPRHGASRGAADAFTQAALLDLYDPRRTKAPLHEGVPTTWASFDAAMTRLREQLDARRGEGFRLLTGAVSSPTLLRQIDAMRARWPQARWHVHEPFGDRASARACARAFGRALEPRLHLDRAQVVVSIDADILGPGPRQTLHALGWKARRARALDGDGESRLLVAEPFPTLTGARADRRLAAHVDRLDALTRGLAQALGVEGGRAPDLGPQEDDWVRAAARALRRAGPHALVVVGEECGSAAIELAFRMCATLGAVGTTLDFVEPIARAPEGAPSLGSLVSDLNAGAVDVLAILDANPAHTAPPGLGFSEALEKAALRLHAGTREDETAVRCHWRTPLDDHLETWSDARAADGAAVILQPLVRPFHSVRSRHAILAAWTGGEADALALVRETWRAAWPAVDGPAFEERWRRALLQGVASEPSPPVPVEIRPAGVAPAPEAPRGLSVVVRPDPSLWDGRYAANAWLQELPRPFTKIAWSNVLCVSPETARRHEVADGDHVRLTQAGRAVVGQIYVLAGAADDMVLATAGYGRSPTASLAGGEGYDAFALWGADGAVGACRIAKTGTSADLVTTQPHHDPEGYDLVRVMTREQAREPKANSEPPTFYPPKEVASPSWGMSIDLDACIGCNACVVACQAENNVPVVGADLVKQGREMHWLRVDHYVDGGPDDARHHFQPVPCMHCERAPCEMGCPVNAAVHSADGLNLQVYNRCIGTRTCSSFCPYKVRRFNWFDFTAADPESVQAMRNPEVTVRQRGVMEKCTYCLQRISGARRQAKKEGRPIADGEVVTACQQTCPTNAISFGDVTDPLTRVSQLKDSARDYALLEDANTRPRTTYLARLAPQTEEGP